MDTKLHGVEHDTCLGRLERLSMPLLASVMSYLSVPEAVRMGRCSRTMRAFDWRRRSLWTALDVTDADVAAWFAGGPILAPWRIVSWQPACPMTSKPTGATRERALAHFHASLGPRVRTLILNAVRRDECGDMSDAQEALLPVQTLSGVPNLEALELHGWPVNDLAILSPAVSNHTTVPRLTHLVLHAANFRRATSERVLLPWKATWATLQTLNVTTCDADLATLALPHMPSLTDLHWVALVAGREHIDVERVLNALPRSGMQRLVLRERRVEKHPAFDVGPPTAIGPLDACMWHCADWSALRILELPACRVCALGDLLDALERAPLEALTIPVTTTPQDIVRVIGTWPGLQTLECVGSANWFTVTEWRQFLTRHPRLKTPHLDLRRTTGPCRLERLATADDLAAVEMYCRELEALCVECHHDATQTLAIIVQRNANLSRLEINAQAFAQIAWRASALLRANAMPTHLTHVDLNDGVELTNDVLRAMNRLAPNLVDLRLHVRNSFIDLSAARVVVETNTGLRVFRLTGARVCLAPVNEEAERKAWSALRERARRHHRSVDILIARVGLPYPIPANTWPGQCRTFDPEHDAALDMLWKAHPL